MDRRIFWGRGSVPNRISFRMHTQKMDFEVSCAIQHQKTSTKLSKKVKSGFKIDPQDLLALLAQFFHGPRLKEDDFSCNLDPQNMLLYHSLPEI